MRIVLIHPNYHSGGAEATRTRKRREAAAAADAAMAMACGGGKQQLSDREMVGAQSRSGVLPGPAE